MIKYQNTKLLESSPNKAVFIKQNKDGLWQQLGQGVRESTTPVDHTKLAQKKAPSQYTPATLQKAQNWSDIMNRTL